MVSLMTRNENKYKNADCPKDWTSQDPVLGKAPSKKQV